VRNTIAGPRQASVKKMQMEPGRLAGKPFGRAPQKITNRPPPVVMITTFMTSSIRS
jgi:hypothetical protein